jgi:hypothetical protein
MIMKLAEVTLNINVITLLLHLVMLVTLNVVMVSRHAARFLRDSCAIR